MNSSNFFSFEKYLFYYDDNDYVRSIDEKGNILSNSDSLSILNKININSDIGEENKIKKEILKDKKKIIIRDNFYSKTGEEFIDNIKLKKAINKTELNISKIVFGRPRYYDKDHNGYSIFNEKDNWKKGGIIVISKNGDILYYYYLDELVYEPNIVFYTRIAISWTGDIYVMRGDTKFYYFYKIPRMW